MLKTLALIAAFTAPAAWASLTPEENTKLLPERMAQSDAMM
ncbi:hypothetical protein AAD018_012050 [Aestuariibius insulae]